MGDWFRMKIRWKYLLILLCFSLPPLVVVTLINQHGTKRLGQTLSENTHTEMTEIISKALALTAHNHAKLLQGSRSSLESALIVVANDAERALAAAPAESLPPVYSADDYDSAERIPPNVETMPHYRKLTADGQEKPMAVSYQHPSYYLAPGAPQAPNEAAISRLSRLVPGFIILAEELGDLMFRVYISLESGLHMSYPGHGGYPKNYDPRTRPWYQRAVNHEYESKRKIAWTLPMVDVTSGRVVFTASRPISAPDGTLAGVVGLDVLITQVLQESELAALWSSEMRAFYVMSDRHSENDSPRLGILAQRAYQEKATSWKGVIAFESLESSDTQQYQRLLQDLHQGNSGYVDMPYRGVQSMWAYADVDSKTHFVMIVPKSVIMRLPEKNSRAMLDFTNRHLIVNAVAAVALVILLGIAALYGSRATTKKILKIARAAKRLANGDLSARIELKTGDERDQVIDAFNQMGPRLQDHLRIRNALNLAQEVQQNLLPKTTPHIFGLDIAGSSIYCDETGGDYYDFFKIGSQEKSRLAVIVGDVSGHGISSALLMATARALLRQRAAMPGKATQILSDVNRQLSFDTIHTSQFMTLFYCEFDPHEQVIHWIRAGHDPAMVFTPHTNTFEELKGRGIALGLDETFQFTECRRNLSPGEIILIGTDGIWEMHNDQGHMFGKEKIQNIIRHNADLTATELQEAITRALSIFKGSRPSEDDVTMVIVKVL